MTRTLDEHVKTEACLRPRARERYETRPWRCPFCGTRWVVTWSGGWHWKRYR